MRRCLGTVGATLVLVGLVTNTGAQIAQQGVAESQTAMARGLLFGDPARRDRDRAIDLLRSASGSHYGPAEFVLGALLSFEKNYPLSVKEGEDLLARAARDGCAGADGRLGLMIFTASYVNPETMKRSLEYLRAGAKAGDGTSQQLLAISYRRGGFVLEQDLVTAYAWAHVAHAAHPGQSQGLADRSAQVEQSIAGELAKKDRARADILASDLMKRYARESDPFCSQADDAFAPPK